MSCIKVFIFYNLLDNAFMQSSLGLQVLFISIVIHLIYRPYMEDTLDQVETCSLVTSILCLSCGGLLLNDETSKEWKMMATILIFVSIFSFIIYVIVKLCYTYKDNVNTVSHEIESRVKDVKHKISDLIQMVTLKKKEKEKVVKSKVTENEINLKTNALHKKKIKNKNINDDQNDIDGLELSVSNEINRKL